MKNKATLFDYINTIILLFISIICLYPFVYIFVQSISDGRAVVAGQVNIIPKGINFETYKYVFTQKNLYIFQGLLNSFLYTVFGTIVAVLSTYITAYVLTRKQFVGRYFIMRLFVISWVFEAGIIPAYIVLSKLGFVNNPLVMIIPGAIIVQFLIICKTFLEGLPYELEEAAYIDGATDFQIMYRVYLPLTKPIIVTIGTFYAITIWNQYLMPLIYLQDQKYTTIQLVLKKLVISSGAQNTTFKTVIHNGIMLNPGNLKATAIFLAMAPIIFIYPLVQKHIKAGILEGSIK